MNSPISAYRISGDEFVVIMKNVNKNEFESLAEKLREKINACEYPVASFGISFGVEKEIKNHIAISEEKMYADKKAFYVKYPMYKR